MQGVDQLGEDEIFWRADHSDAVKSYGLAPAVDAAAREPNDERLEKYGVS